MRLSLRRETLAALTSDELTAVNGGSHACTVTHGPSIDQACPTPTLPVAICAGGVTRTPACAVVTQVTRDCL